MRVQYVKDIPFYNKKLDTGTGRLTFILGNQNREMLQRLFNMYSKYVNIYKSCIITSEDSDFELSVNGPDTVLEFDGQIYLETKSFRMSIKRTIDYQSQMHKDKYALIASATTPSCPPCRLEMIIQALVPEAIPIIIAGYDELMDFTDIFYLIPPRLFALEIPDINITASYPTPARLRLESGVLDSFGDYEGGDNGDH